jgi:hypothetical protein
VQISVYLLLKKISLMIAASCELTRPDLEQCHDRMQKIENWDSRNFSPAGTPNAVVHDTTYYLKCMLGGVLSCGLTHTAVVPLDIAKCKMQGIY